MAFSRFIPALLAATVLLTGCSAAFGFFTARSMKGDLEELFQMREVSVPLQSCKMINNSRMGYCLTEASEGDLETLIKAFELQEVTSPPPIITSKDFFAGCGGVLPGTQGNKMYASYGNRPESLRLAPGKAFDSLLLYISSNNQVSCIQISVAFG